MISPRSLVEIFSTNNVRFFTGVPDSLLKNFCAYVTDSCGDNHVIAANEGGAVALASGHYLATGHPALVYMQNSGQGNAVNPLCSLADPDVYSIPMLLLVGWRGEPGTKDEPQHVKQGKVTIPLFETLGIPTYVLSNEEAVALRQTQAAIQQAVLESRPVALVVRKGILAEYHLQHRNPDISVQSREQTIEMIVKEYGHEAVFVSTTGKISRELYEIRVRLGQDHTRDFLTVGSMGHASMIALGIARANPHQLVICIDGDGASIMQMGNMAILGQSGCANLLHIVLNNAAHDSVGGQPTVGGDISLPEIARACGYCVASFLPGVHVSAMGHPVFMEIRVAKGSRPDLGRPKEAPQENKSLFMQTLAKMHAAHSHPAAGGA